MNTCLVVIVSLVATLIITISIVELQFYNLVASGLVYISFLGLDYLQKRVSGDFLSVMKLQIILMLTKTIFKFPNSVLIECLNRNSLYLQIVFVILTQMGRGVQKRSLILFPIVINFIHTIYLNPILILEIQGQEKLF